VLAQPPRKDADHSPGARTEDGVGLGTPREKAQSGAMISSIAARHERGAGVMMRMYLFLAPLLLLPGFARADQAADAAQCQQAAGSFLAGTVTKGPTFKGSNERIQGVFLSHTHLTLQADDGTSYDVAIDNVFANGYQRNKAAVPAPLNSIKVGDKLEVCGQPFPGGIHWVHTDCGVTPTADKPNGFVRTVDAGGMAGDNLEANQTWCKLWPN